MYVINRMFETMCLTRVCNHVFTTLYVKHVKHVLNTFDSKHV
jgi:hypothetical protein